MASVTPSVPVIYMSAPEGSALPLRLEPELSWPSSRDPGTRVSKRGPCSTAEQRPRSRPAGGGGKDSGIYPTTKEVVRAVQPEGKQAGRQEGFHSSPDPQLEAAPKPRAWTSGFGGRQSLPTQEPSGALRLPPARGRKSSPADGGVRNEGQHTATSILHAWPGSAGCGPHSPASEAWARLLVSRPSGPISICPRGARSASVGPGFGDSGRSTMAQPSSHEWSI